MNYLGHAYLSFGDAQLLTGNLIADHVKGKIALQRFPEGIQKGIELHRKIDVFTDNHPATARAKNFFRNDYGLYAGALIDSLYDHFLANDPRQFESEKALFDFSQETYKDLDAYSEYFPERFASYFPFMKEQNWLYNYRTLAGVQRSLGGLQRRAQYMSDVKKAYEIFIANYYQLTQCYYELIDDMVRYIKGELSHQ